MKDGTLSNKIVILIFVFLFTGACASALFYIRNAGNETAQHEIRDPFAVATEPVEPSSSYY